MKILAKYMTADTQVHTGKCYYIGSWVTSGKTGKFYNIEAAGSLATSNQIANNYGSFQMLPKPGVECSNGLYIVVDGNEAVYWSLG